MKTMNLVFFLGFLTLLTACQDHALLVVNQRPLLPVEQAGRTVYFSVDTGADTSLIAASMVPVFHLQTEPWSFQVSRLGGLWASGSLRIRGEGSVSGFKTAGFLVTGDETLESFLGEDEDPVFSRGPADKMPRPLVGFLGRDSLGDKVLDFSNGTIRILDQPPAIPGTYRGFKLQEVTTPQGFGGFGRSEYSINDYLSVTLIIDTGMPYLAALVADPAGLPPDLTVATNTVLLTTQGRPVPVVQLPELVGLGLPSLPYFLVAPPGDPARSEIDRFTRILFLGLPYLTQSKAILDLRNRMIYLDPRAVFHQDPAKDPEVFAWTGHFVDDGLKIDTLLPGSILAKKGVVSGNIIAAMDSQPLPGSMVAKDRNRLFRLGSGDFQELEIR